MKTILLLLTGCSLIATLMTACGTTQECPAYGQNTTTVETTSQA